jgi:hypothetical protein
MNLNKYIKDFLIGTLLGDAHIGRTGLNKAFISFEQSSKKKEYLNYLFNITKEGEIPLIGETIKEYIREDSRYKTINKSLYFRTQSLESLKPMLIYFKMQKGTKSYLIILRII